MLRFFFYCLFMASSFVWLVETSRKTFRMRGFEVLFTASLTTVNPCHKTKGYPVFASTTGSLALPRSKLNEVFNGAIEMGEPERCQPA